MRGIERWEELVKGDLERKVEMRRSEMDGEVGVKVGRMEEFLVWREMKR